MEEEKLFFSNDINKTVDVLSSIPLYHQIQNILKKTIDENNIQPGTQIPSEEKLVEYFKVSRPTINRAIAELVQCSVLSKQKGKRAFVKDKSYFDLLLVNELVSFGKDLNSKKIPHSTRVLKANRIKTNEKLAKLFNLEINEYIYFLVRLRLIKDEPVILVNNYLPEKYFAGFLKQDFEKRDLYEILANEYGVYIKKGERKVTALKCSNEESRLLHMPVGDPIIFLESIQTSTDERKIEYFESKLKGEKIALTATVFPKR